MIPIFTPEQRARLRSGLIESASRDPRISGVAITGSAAAGREDRWSDIDLAFGILDAAELPDILSDWTARMYDRRQALHHLDIRFGAWIYRVFLLPGALQVDLAFVPSTEFRALAPTFQLVCGTANDPRHAPSSPPNDIIGLAWLHALHARSSLARRNLWQAEYMISGVRDHALALGCLRYGLPAVHGRGMDQLPDSLKARYEACLVRHLDTSELARAFRAVVQELLAEIRSIDAPLAERLEAPLTGMSETPAEASA